MYEFVSGPLVWLSFGIFFVGMIYKTVSLVRLTQKKDRVVFNHFSWNWSLKSIVRWLLPFGSRSMRERPGLTVVTFVFHFCLLVTPLFLQAHTILWRERWGIQIWSFSEATGDLLTLFFIAAATLMVLRRIAFPDVKIVTTAYDFLLLGIVLAPFVTGYFASHNLLHYKTMLILHILAGEIMLIAIPFTKMSHFVLFFLTRAHIASEMGQRRGAPSW